MFSDKFIEINNYSLLKKEYLNTSSIMPWRYTSVFDDNYKPDLSEEIKNKFQLFFYYRLLYTAQILEDDRKYLEITHKDNIIKEYRTINPIKLVCFMDPGEWNHFIHTLEIVNLNECKEKIFKYVGNSIVVSGITSITYDESCQATGIYYQHDPQVILNHSETLDKLCEIFRSIRNLTTNIHVNPFNNKLRYNVILNYVERRIKFLKTTKQTPYNSSNYVPYLIENQPQTDQFFDLLHSNNIFDDETLEYVKQVVPNNTKVELEFFINEDGTLDDIVLKNIVVEHFENLAQ